MPRHSHGNAGLEWFPFNVVDWLTSEDVALMSLAAEGAYIRLLCYQWHNGSLPESAAQIGRLVGRPGCIEDVWEELEHLFPVDSDGRRRNLRLESVRTEQDRIRTERSESQRQKAQRRWQGSGSATAEPEQAKPEQSHGNAESGATAMPRDSHGNAPIEKEREEEKDPPVSPQGDGPGESPKAEKRKAEDIPIPEVLDFPEFKRVWGQWLSYRRKRRLTMLEDCLARQLAELAEHPLVAVQAIDEAITKGWQAPFPEKLAKKLGVQRAADSISQAEEAKRRVREKLGVGS